MNIYIHTPFCRGKCDYCAFYSEGNHTPEDESAWLSKLKQDVEKADIREEIETLYIGGGTPVILSPEHLKGLYNFLRSAFRYAPSAEITTECNPESLTSEKADLMAGFINRVSMGIQSFVPEKLRRIGRRNTDTDTGSGERAAAMLKRAGVRNIGIDLICGAPGETLQQWKEELDRALNLDVTHISAYSLILEEGTPLWKRLKDVPEDGELSADMWELTGQYLGGNGFPRYEISNYAAPSFECRHNQNVWHGKPYAGFGPSACSFDGTDRFEQASPLAAWLDGVPPERDSIDPEKRRREVFMMGLRTVRGWNTEEFDWTFLLPELKQMADEGLLLVSEKSVIPTERGLALWDDVAERLLG